MPARPREVVVFGVGTAQDGGHYETMLMFNPASGRLTNYLEKFNVGGNPTHRPDFDVDRVNRFIAIFE